MTSTGGHALRVALVAAALVLILVAGQWAASAAAPAPTGVTTASALGTTGFAYLSGLRTFAAAVLWNRIEPLFHEYYGGVPLAEQTYMLPTLNAVVALDPQFTQAYYIASYMVFRTDPERGIALAREGVARNPDSGILHANLAQLLFIQDRIANRGAILEQVRKGSAEDAQWLDAGQQYEGFATMSQALIGIGESARAADMQATMAEIKRRVGDVGDHDHDGDGKQDH